MPEHEQEPQLDSLRRLLIDWFNDDEGIADEMSWRQIDRQNERREQLLAVGIDPYGWPCPEHGDHLLPGCVVCESFIGDHSERGRRD